MIRRFFLVILGVLTVAATSHAVTRAPSGAEASTETATDEGSTPKTDDAAEATPAEAQSLDVAPSEGQPAEAEAAAPEAAAPVSPLPKAPAQRERLSAFAKGPLRFSSIGRVKAFMIKFDRDLRYTMKPIAKDGHVEAVDVTMVDHANGNKVTHGRLDVTPSGALKAHSTTLTNACNIGLIDPITRAKLIKSDAPVDAHAQMELQGKILILEVTHTREGDVGEDGSMRVRSECQSTDGKVKTTTVTTLAPDGLPWLAETTGTIAKGPINLDVNIKLTREGVGETQSGE